MRLKTSFAGRCLYLRRLSAFTRISLPVKPIHSLFMIPITLDAPSITLKITSKTSLKMAPSSSIVVCVQETLRGVPC